MYYMYDEEMLESKHCSEGEDLSGAKKDNSIRR